jgi:hypothetical protein
MKTLTTLASLCVIACLSPGLASAALILDPGTPPLTGTADAVLNTEDWYAEEFAVTAGETITQLSAFLTQDVGQPGDTFTFALYSASGTFIGANSSTRTPPVYSATGTFSANGWNTLNLASTTSGDFTPAAGDYWLAVQVTSTSQTRGLDMPTESSASMAAGTAPALLFAAASGSTNPKYQLETGNEVGLQVTATSNPVPLPPGAWLLGSGLLGLAAVRRRRGA